MGRIVVTEFISLDGVVEAPHEWHFPYFDDAMGKVIEAGMETSSAFLMGRKLYDEWSSYWPEQGPEVPFSEFINTIPKYVLSTTLKDPTWQNTHVIETDVEAAVRELKQKPGRELQVHGSGDLLRWLLERDLVDELNLEIHPVVVGDGLRLFPERGQTHDLVLVESRSTPSGVTILSYRPAGRATFGTAG